MRAIVQDRYGSLRPGDLPRPEPGPDEVLVRVRAASVHPDVWHVVNGRPFVLRLMGSGVRRPKCPVPGTDMAGVVEAVGGEVRRFKAGDEVFGETLRGMSWRNGGTFAEYVTAPEEILAPKPANVSFEQAATVPTAGYITLLNVPLALLTPGKRVLVNGAAGGVGAIVVQLAKAHGAEVTGVDHPAKLESVTSLGADHVIDYTTEDFTRGSQYELIVDIPGNRSWAECRRALTDDGAYVLIGHDHYGSVGRRWLGSIPRFAGLTAASTFTPQLRRGNVGKLNKAEAILQLRHHLEAGQLTPVVAKAFPLDEAAGAIRYLAEVNPPGRIVLTLS